MMRVKDFPICPVSIQTLQKDKPHLLLLDTPPCPTSQQKKVLKSGNFGRNASMHYFCGGSISILAIRSSNRKFTKPTPH
ncbi:hypothetical protein GDO81_000149 [Engystomops pustulosus]|uniref:Uncharacterized protein n=1 Tax=Engystomops pustulosus TaxID=76066 RepID=A0AAV7D373_ENGPU|nr:hypothetical protein GDO81_000149 [Engystomops pustulosus]